MQLPKRRAHTVLLALRRAATYLIAIDRPPPKHAQSLHPLSPAAAPPLPLRPHHCDAFAVPGAGRDHASIPHGYRRTRRQAVRWQRLVPPIDKRRRSSWTPLHEKWILNGSLPADRKNGDLYGNRRNLPGRNVQEGCTGESRQATIYSQYIAIFFCNCLG